MTKDREIVLMLILRMRRARALWSKYKDRDDPTESQLYGHYIESWNAAELARRLLYGYEL